MTPEDRRGIVITRHFLAGLRARYKPGGWLFTPDTGLSMERYADEALAAYLATLAEPQQESK